MKLTKPLLVLAASFLLLSACGGNNDESSSSLASPEDTSSLTSSSSESVEEPTSSPSEETTSSTGDVDTETSSQDDSPTEHAITLIADAASVGLTLSAPSSALSGSLVTLEVTLEEGHILEYIRLHAPTAQEGGVRVEANAEGAYVFTMPKQDVKIYYKAVVGYKVHFASDHATAVLAEDSAEYDAFGEGYPVYVKKETVEANYAFSGFTVTGPNGEAIETWNDRVDQVGFRMPKGDVTVTAHAVPLDEAFVPIAGTYTGGIQIDMNEPSNVFELQIEVSGRITFKTDWTDPYWTGMATYDGTTIEADLNHLTQDGYYGSEVRHFKASFTSDKRFFSAELSSLGPNPATYHYVFGKPTERIVAKKLYRSDFIGGNYALADRVYSIGAASGDFFTYVDSTRSKAHYFLHAYPFDSNEEVYSFLANTKYALKDSAGKTVITLDYNGTTIEVGGKETGTYTCEGEEELILDGFGGYTLGAEKGTYTISGNDVTLSSGKVATLDLDTLTYTLGSSPVVPDQPAHPFSGKKYGTSTTSPITFYDEYYENSTAYQLIVTFGNADGAIASIELKRLEDSGASWPIGSERSATENLSYVYDAENMTIAANFGGKNATLVYNAKTDTIAYRGTLWNCDQGDNQRNNSNQTLTLIA